VEDITSLEPAIVSIETAIKNGITLLPSGEEINISPPRGDYDRESIKIVADTLVQNGKAIKAMLLDPKFMPEKLSNAQGWLSESQRVFLHTLDLWTRLEQINTSFFSDIKCIVGEKGCPEDAIVICESCRKGRNNTQEGLL
tara:strand:+ start:1109 stop:1531 length:423 start_codon:yes stop_codon:yes gene_type:complete